ncbi:MAG: ATP-binding protein [Rubrobacter sp.]|nr:ATP-binding protein [Rubrobacter sp.]
MEGPYRDLGSGFARLSGAEVPRRAPSSISTVEDALFELLRNARDAGASSIYVASALRSRRYRSLTVIDDGRGVPEAYSDVIFEPGVTTRHLDPNPEAGLRAGVRSGGAHGAGLALHHIRNAAVEARLAHPSSPTSVRVVFDTSSVPERSLQSETRGSKSNLLAAARSFAADHPNLRLFYASHAAILASLLENLIIQESSRAEISAMAEGLGLDVSPKTVGRVLRGEVGAARRVGSEGGAPRSHRTPPSPASPGGRPLYIGEDARAEVRDILGRAARASYMEVVDVKFESRPGEVSIKVRVHEPEDEYD